PARHGEHGLAAAEGKVDRRPLVGHALREPKRILEAVRGRRVHVHPAPAHAHAERAVVDRDEDPRVRRPVVVDQDALPVPLAKEVVHYLAGPGFGAGVAGTGGRWRPGTLAANPAGMGGPCRPGCSRWMP